MKRRTWLTGVGLVLALGPGASSAMAETSQVSVGGGQLRIAENEDPAAPLGDGGDANNLQVTFSSGSGVYTIRDATALVTTISNNCDVVDPATVTCTASGGNLINGITVTLKEGEDFLDIAENIMIGATVTGDKGGDQILGGGGPDSINGGGGVDIIRGRGGNDTIDTRGDTTPEADKINCGAGTDTAIIDNRDGFMPAGSDVTDNSDGECESIQRPAPPPGTDTGGGGTGTGAGQLQNQAAVNPIQLGSTPPPGTPAPPADIACRSQTFIGTANNERFLGTNGGDRMVGGAGNDVMDGLAGEDCLYGQAGSDTMRGGAADDRISGGDGNDRGDGGDGNDGLYGAGGVDVLLGRVGNDLLSGGDGNDRMYGAAGADRFSGGGGRDRVDAGAGNDRVVAGTGRDTVIAGSGNDLIDVRDGSRDVVSCGPGRDTVVRDRLDVLRNCERRASRLPRAS